MSKLDLSITNEQVIPQIESQLFDGHETARFAVGMLAVGDTVLEGREEEYVGYLRLRANVYVDQTRMISKESVAEDGTERDQDDSRALHYAIVEKGEKGHRVVAAMRLIIKDLTNPEPLPIEEFFHEEVFEAEPAPMGSLEFSRYICRHEDAKTQERLRWPLYSAVIGYITRNGLGPTYGVVETHLEKGLLLRGIPIEKIADPKYIAEYDDYNLGIRVDSVALANKLGLTGISNVDETELVYFDEKVKPVAAFIPEQSTVA